MRIVALVAIILALAAPGRAEEAPITPKMRETAARLIERALDEDTGYRVVESLTTEVGPRLAGTEGEARARDWAVAKLNELGFKNVRVEPFEVPLWERGVETAEITTPYPQKLIITALGGSPATPREGVEGAVVSFASLEALGAAAPSSLKGKIVFIDEKTTRTQDGSGYGAGVRKRYDTPFDVQGAGAVGVLIRSVGTSSHRFPHTGSMLSGREEEPVPAAALSAPDADQIARALERGEEVRVRMTLTPVSRSAAPSGNVIAEIPGRTRPEEIVLISAHLDSWDLGTGAVDDGAGVGIVVGAASVINETLRRAPKRTIRIVLFGSEEVGLVGARAYNHAHADELSEHIIAAESDFGASTIWRFDSRVAEDKLLVADAIGLALAPLGIARGGNEARGGPDMRVLRASGVPVAGLIQNGWDYFDLHHTPNDTFDKIDPEELAQNVAAYAAFAYLAAETDAYFRAAPEPLALSE
ncbi:MAG: M28 family peptidase [Pseudomonadota bacterium]